MVNPLSFGQEDFDYDPSDEYEMDDCDYDDYDDDDDYDGQPDEMQEWEGLADAGFGTSEDYGDYGDDGGW